ncbi:trimeric autotransporter adhesin, partial [Nicoletella semolina]
MNKIFKVIFNKSTQTWTAVSELSKANGKSSTKVDKRANLSAGKVRVVAATLVVSVVSNTVVSAASTSSNGGIKAGTASGEDSIAIGEGSKAGTNGSKGAIAIGKDSKAIAGATIAIGRGAQNLSAGNSIAFGSGAKTYSNYSISIGDEAEAGKIMSVLDSVGYYKSNIIENAIAIGRKARAINESTVAIGHSASGLGEYAIALGHKAEAGNAGWGAIAIGAQAQAIAGAAIAIGRGAMNQSLGNSIAFGSDAHTYSGYSIAIGNLAQAGIPITGTKHTLGYYDNGHSNAVAIGNKATAIGEGSIALGKDANTKTKYSIVLGAEAQSSREEFNDGEGSVVIGYKAKEINHLLVGMGEGKNNIIIGREALSAGNNVVGIGYQANAWSPNSVAIGNKAQALGAGNTVGSDVAIGDSAISYNQDAIALGHGAKAGIEWTKTTWDKNTDAPNYAVGSKGAIAIGANAKAIAGATIAIGRDAQNLSSGNSIAFGSNTKTYSGYSIAIGDQAQAGTKGTQNSDAKYYTDSQTESAVAIGQNARATHLKAIALGADSQTGDYVNAKDSTKTTLMFNDHQNQAISVSSFKFAGSDNGNNQRYVLSVGNNALKRQIQNVAAGIISESSTDAINGSQLYYVAQNVGFNIQRNGTPVSRVNNNHIVNFKDSTPNITASVAEKGNQTDIEIKLSDHLKVKDIVTESLTATGDITVSEINAGSIIASDIEASEATFENALTVNSGPTVLGGSLQVEGESIFKGKVIFDGGVEVRKVVKNITTVNSTDFEVGGEAKFKDHVDFEAGATVYGELNVDDVVATGTVNANNLEAATAQISNLTVNEKIEARKGVDLGIGSGEVAEHETRAVSGEVVARAIEEVKNTGFKVKAKDGETHTIKSGDVLTFDATQEMTVDQTNGTVTYGLATPVLDTLKAAQARTDSGVVGGNTTDSTGKQVEGALALGKDSIALGTNSMAMGFTATASANGAIATGVNSKASGSDSTAIGANSQATEEQSTATGQNAQATGNNATASGANSKATADGATASG